MTPVPSFLIYLHFKPLKSCSMFKSGKYIRIDGIIILCISRIPTAFLKKHLTSRICVCYMADL
jgi:hypothetical protein